MYCVCWCDLDPIQGQGQPIGAFEVPTISKAVHAGGDDRSPLWGFLVSERDHVNLRARSLYAVRSSVCRLSVTLVHPT